MCFMLVYMCPACCCVCSIKTHTEQDDGVLVLVSVIKQHAMLQLMYAHRSHAVELWLSLSSVKLLHVSA